MKKVLLGKYLISEVNKVKENWGIAIKDNIVEEIGENEYLINKYRDYDIWDCKDKVISPGFVNSHMHAYGVLSHGITPSKQINSFESFLDDFWWPMVENRIDHTMIEITSKATALELLNSGVTTFCNIMEAPYAIPGALKVQAKVLEKIGIRAVLSFEASERVSIENGLAGLEENKLFYLDYIDHPLISGMMCIHTTFTCSKDFIKNAVNLAREIKSGIQMHLSESSYEQRKCIEKYGKTPVELYEELGYLGRDVLASQCVKLSEKEINLLKKYDVKLAHLPLSNCEVGGGVSPVPEMLKKGIQIGLGTDGYINNFFEVMRGAFLIHKAYNENPDLMKASEVFKMATYNGSKVLNIPKIGKLEKGYFADIITIDTDLFTPINKNNLFDQIILYRNSENVKEVIVNGKLIKKDGKLIGFDLKEIRKEVRQEASRLWKEAK